MIARLTSRAINPLPNDRDWSPWERGRPVRPGAAGDHSLEFVLLGAGETPASQPEATTASIVVQASNPQGVVGGSCSSGLRLRLRTGRPRSQGGFATPKNVQSPDTEYPT